MTGRRAWDTGKENTWGRVLFSPQLKGVRHERFLTYFFFNNQHHLGLWQTGFFNSFIFAVRIENFVDLWFLKHMNTSTIYIQYHGWGDLGIQVVNSQILILSHNFRHFCVLKFWRNQNKETKRKTDVCQSTRWIRIIINRAKQATVFVEFFHILVRNIQRAELIVINVYITTLLWKNRFFFSF